MNSEMFRLSLIDVMDRGLLNLFVNRVFDYDLKDDEYVYIQYKLISGNVVLNIFDNKDDNRFKAYIFCYKDIDNSSDDDSFYFNIKELYNKYKNGSDNKIDLIGSLLYSNDINEKKEIIDILFTGEINDIFSHHFL